MLEESYADLCELIVDLDAVKNHVHVFSGCENPNSTWVRWFMTSGPGRNFIRNVTTVCNLNQFRDHFVAYSNLKMRSNIITAMERLQQICDLRDDKSRFRAQASSEKSLFDRIIIESVTYSPKLCHVLAASKKRAVLHWRHLAYSCHYNLISVH